MGASSSQSLWGKPFAFALSSKKINFSFFGRAKAFYKEIFGEENVKENKWRRRKILKKTNFPMSEMDYCIEGLHAHVVSFLGSVNSRRVSLCDGSCKANLPIEEFEFNQEALDELREQLDKETCRYPTAYEIGYKKEPQRQAKLLAFFFVNKKRQLKLVFFVLVYKENRTPD